MAIKVTRWNPDTCECIIDYSWDDTTSEDDRVVTPTTIVQRCTAHENLQEGDVNTHFNSVTDENRRKNYTVHEILQNGPSSLYDINEADGSKTFKNGVSVNWSWSGTAPDRIMTIEVIGVTLTTQQKNVIQNVLNNRFGIDKVVIV